MRTKEKGPYEEYFKYIKEPNQLAVIVICAVLSFMRAHWRRTSDLIVIVESFPSFPLINVTQMGGGGEQLGKAANIAMCG